MKMELIAALIHKPKLIFLDEPTHHVETSRFQTRHYRIPLSFFKFDFDAQFVGNGAGNFHIVTGQLAVFVVVGKRRVSAFGADGNRPFIVVMYVLIRSVSSTSRNMKIPLLSIPFNGGRIANAPISVPVVHRDLEQEAA